MLTHACACHRVFAAHHTTPHRVCRLLGALRSCRSARPCCPTAAQPRCVCVPGWRGAPPVCLQRLALCVAVLSAQLDSSRESAACLFKNNRQATFKYNPGSKAVELVVDRDYKHGELRGVFCCLQTHCQLCSRTAVCVCVCVCAPPFSVAATGDPVYAWCGPQPNSRLLLNCECAGVWWQLVAVWLFASSSCTTRSLHATRLTHSSPPQTASWMRVTRTTSCS